MLIYKQQLDVTMNINFKSLAQCMILATAVSVSINATALDNQTVNQNSLRVLQECNISPNTLFGHELSQINKGLVGVVTQITGSVEAAAQLYKSSGACEPLEKAAVNSLASISPKEQSTLVDNAIYATIEPLHEALLRNSAYFAKIEELFGVPISAPLPVSTVPSSIPPETVENSFGM